MPALLRTIGRQARVTLLAATLLALVVAPAPSAANSPNPHQPTISALNGVIRQIFNRGAEEASAIGTLGRGLYGSDTGGDLYILALSGEHGDGPWRIDQRMEWVEGLQPNRRWNHWWQSTRQEIAAERAELHQRLRWIRDLWAAYDALVLLRNQLQAVPDEPASAPPERVHNRPPGTPPVHIPSAHTKRPPRVDVKQPRPRPGGKY